jgi:hypothetical protein
MNCEIKPIAGHEHLGLTFAVCGNAETLGIDSAVRIIAIDSAVGIILDAGFDCEIDSCFQNWNGGRRVKFGAVHQSGITAYIWHRDRDEDGEWTEWAPCLTKPAEAISEANRVVVLASDSLASKSF